MIAVTGSRSRWWEAGWGRGRRGESGGSARASWSRRGRDRHPVRRRSSILMSNYSGRHRVWVYGRPSRRRGRCRGGTNELGEASDSRNSGAHGILINISVSAVTLFALHIVFVIV